MRIADVGVVEFLLNERDYPLEQAPPSPIFNNAYGGCPTINLAKVTPQRRLHSGLQFNLKDADFVLSDGTTYLGTVGTATIVGDTTVAVALTTGVTIPVGLPLYQTVNKEYVTVTAQSTTGSGTATTTNKVTVSPALANVWAKDSSITFGPHQLFVKVGKGNISYTEHKPREYNLDRGNISEVRDGDDQPMDITFSFNWEFITGDTSDPPTVEDFLKFRNAAVAYKSSDTSQPCRPKSVDLSIRLSENCGNTKGEWITLPFFRYEQLQHDANAGSISCQGKSNALEALVSRTNVFPLDTSF